MGFYQGALDMGFYNMPRGDAWVLNFLARHYSLSDNYHQAVMGGTGANHIALGTGYAAYYQNAGGTPTPPPAGQVESPSPQPVTNNPGKPYVPENRPAIGDPFDMFDFSHTQATLRRAHLPRLRSGGRMSRALVHIPNALR